MVINNLCLNLTEFIKKKLSERFDKEYQNKFIEKIMDNFNDTEKDLFIIQFYDYEKKNDFIINLDDIWKILGLSTKDKCKIILSKNFEKDKDYIINNDIILMKVYTFKVLCGKSFTKEGDELYDNVLKMDKNYYDLIIEELNELRKNVKLIN